MDLTARFAIARGFATGSRLAIRLALAREVRLTTSLALVPGLRFGIVLGLPIASVIAAGWRFVTGLDLVPGLRMTEAGRVLVTASGRRGFGLVSEAADLVLLADDARFMG